MFERSLFGRMAWGLGPRATPPAGARPAPRELGRRAGDGGPPADAVSGATLTLRPTGPVVRAETARLAAGRETTWATRRGVLRVAQRAGSARRDVRILRASGGPVGLAIEVRPRAGLGWEEGDVRIVPGRGAVVRLAGERRLVLAWPGWVEAAGGGVLRGSFALDAGTAALCVLAEVAGDDHARALLAAAARWGARPAARRPRNGPLRSSGADVDFRSRRATT